MDYVPNTRLTRCFKSLSGVGTRLFVSFYTTSAHINCNTFIVYDEASKRQRDEYGKYNTRIAKRIKKGRGKIEAFTETNYLRNNISDGTQGLWWLNVDNYYRYTLPYIDFLSQLYGKSLITYSETMNEPMWPQLPIATA